MKKAGLVCLLAWSGELAFCFVKYVYLGCSLTTYVDIHLLIYVFIEIPAHARISLMVWVWGVEI